MEERFEYDDMDRLTGITLKRPSGQDLHCSVTYDDYGRMTMKYLHGNTVFDETVYNAAGRPHAVKLARMYSPQPDMSMGYTSFDKLRNVRTGNLSLTYGYGYEHQRLSMVETFGNDTIKTKEYVGNCEFVTEDNGTYSTSYSLTYLSGPLGVFAVRDTRMLPESKRMYYVHPDHLGSWTTVTAWNGRVVQDVWFDPWGTAYNNPSGSAPFQAVSLLFDRGFTGHEHLMGFGLINMNGRGYDPVTSSFLSVDNYVQDPSYTQNFNRYTYCLNNPLKYTDPDGEIFGTVFGFVSDLINNVFVRTFKGEKWDWTQTKNGWEIDKSIFYSDPNKSTGARIWEIISRFTWQLPQTLIGDLFVSGMNAAGRVNNITHGYGITAVDMGLEIGAVTIGYFTAGPEGYKADWRDHLFVHEYGHYVQSQQHGPLYLFSVAIPSLQSAILQTKNYNSPRHKNRWFEADASYKGSAYFDKYYGSGTEGYVAGSPDYFDRYSFAYEYHSPYKNPRTGLYVQNPHPISGKFHWTDIPIYIPLLGLFPYLLYL